MNNPYKRKTFQNINGVNCKSDLWKEAYILIDKEHVNTHQFTTFPYIFRLPVSG